MRAADFDAFLSLRASKAAGAASTDPFAPVGDPFAALGTGPAPAAATAAPPVVPTSAAAAPATSAGAAADASGLDELFGDLAVDASGVTLTEAEAEREFDALVAPSAPEDASSKQ